jgi:acetylornithine deacetylase/succinyl-diaminopimelate desuccinylase-like protein
MSQAIQAADPRGIPIPLMIPGFTDAKSWSRLGPICYGFSPVELPDDPALTFSRLYHGHDERIPEAGFRWGLRVLYDAVRRFASK